MEEIDRQLATVLPLTAGLLVLGTLSILCGRIPFAWRLAAGALTTAGGYALVASAYDWTTYATHFVVAITAAALAAAVAHIGRRPSWLCTPAGYGTALVAAGSTGLLALYLDHEQAMALLAEREVASLTVVDSGADRVLLPDVHLVTDRGSEVPVFRTAHPRSRIEADRHAQEVTAAPFVSKPAIQRQPADEAANCHGWVFTGGRYIVPNSAVDVILHDNGYAAVPTAAPGDVVVYRNLAGEVIHTAVVRFVAPGRVPMVEGKWGWMGVYLHAADECSYGQHFAFYRSHRDGDLLKGLNGSTGVGFTGAE